MLHAQSGEREAGAAADVSTALYRLTDQLYRAKSLDDVYNAALDAIRDTLGCQRASILLFDDEGVMRFVAWRGISDHYRRMLEGHSPWVAGTRDPQPIYVENIDDTAEPEWIRQQIRQEGIRGLAFIPLVIQGEAVGKFMTYYADPHRFAPTETELATTIARQVGFSLQRARAEAARRAAEQDLRASEEQFRLMSEHAPVMIWTCDPTGQCMNLNARLREFWGLDGNGIADFDWLTTVHPEDADYVAGKMADAIANRSHVSLGGRFRNAAGEYRTLLTEARPHFSATGKFHGLIGVNVDITERRKAEEQRELLVAELNHRVKNTLAVVQGIAHQTFTGSGSLESEKEAFVGRLLALSTAHYLLTQTHWESAALGDVIAEASRPHGDYGDRIKRSGPMVLLQPKDALSIALATHELYTNALKYGALSNQTGKVLIEWSLTAPPQRRMRIIWQETGGPPVSPPTHRGFGSRLVERVLAFDLDAEVHMDFRPEGLLCRIDAPFVERKDCQN